MSLVLDCSATLGWLHGDERTPAMEAIFGRVVAQGAIVPSLWPLEIANALTMAVRRKRVTQSFRDEALADLSDLDITIDDDTAHHAWHATVQLADLYRLTVYDTAYLELAQRRRLPLATLDGPLAKAGRAAGISILPE